MKKIFAIALVCLAGFSAKAQDFTFSEFKESPVSLNLGITGGTDISTITTGSELPFDFGYNAGYNAGVIFNLRFLKRNERSNADTGILALQPELRFGTMGAKELKTTYIMIPVMLQIYPIKNLYVEFGPEVCLNIGNSASKSSFECNENTLIDMTNLKANDLMVGVGLGYNLFKGLSIGARYSIGTSKLAGNLPWKNNMIQVNLAYSFKLNKKTAPIFDF